MATHDDLVQLERTGDIATITLNRPDKKNALSLELARKLVDIVEEIETTNVRAVIVRGAGGTFCAGGDLEQSPQEFLTEVEASIEAIIRMRASKLPYIAAIEDAAVGGGLELALACDLRIAGTDAKLGIPEVKVGIFPCAGGTRFLPRIIGMTRTKDLLVTGRLISGETALSWGLVNRAVPTDTVDEEAVNLADEIAANSPVGIGAALQSTNEAFDSSPETGLQWDLELAHTVAHRPDFAEGKQAFLDERAPEFTGE